MKIYNIDQNSVLDKRLLHLAIGNFDGVHLGHKEIINELVKVAKENNKFSAILSFNPHPRKFFSEQLEKYQIIDEKNKQKILQNLNVDYYFLLRFNQIIANLSPTDFIKKIIVKQLNISKLIVGYDFKFGKNREGDIGLLKDYSSIHGFDLEIIDAVKDISSQLVYSSTSIRQAIKSGEVDKAQKMLGYPWIMEGRVIHGDKRARQMSFPTANIAPHEQILPKKGVYAVNVVIDKKNHVGIANFGERPTVDGKKLLLEVHLFNFNKDIYGNYLTVEFLTFIRDEKKFDSFNNLVKQIKEDIQIAETYHLNK